MDIEAIKSEITLKLTGDVLDIELSDAVLVKIINSALREIQRYIDTTYLITVPYSNCIDLKDYDISSVARVYRGEGFAKMNTENSLTVDPMYASQWQLMAGMGNVNKLSDYAYNYAAWNTMLQIRNTTSTDLAFRYDKLRNLLYINIASNYPKQLTIEYIPRFSDVSQITSDYWIDQLIQLAAAIAKVTVGRIRTKYKQSNALWALDGDTLLEEGNAELTAIREKLNASTQLCYPID